MTYQSLYRRYRPRTFAEVRGQDHLVTALRNAVRDDRVGHAYLLSGPRGTGKTSTARILAKALNCPNLNEGEPCGSCESCLAIDHGNSFDVHELDAASNNGVEDVRDLIGKIALGTPGRNKVYILDEVHMLSKAASNALLKTLEEPPPNVVFVLATTDPQNVLPTIRSRTQHYEVHLLSSAELQSLVEAVAADAGLDVDAEGLAHAVRLGAGSARDTLSALDQIAAAGGVDDDFEAVDELVEALCEQDTGRALIAVEAAVSSGRSPRLLGEQLISRLRDVFLAAMKADLKRLSDRDRDRVTEQARRLGAGAVTRAIETLGDAFMGINDAPDPRIPLEIALVKLTRVDLDNSLSGLAARIERLERGSAVPAPSAGSAAPSSTGPERSGDAPDRVGEPGPRPASDGAAPPPDRPGRGGDGPAAQARQALGNRRPPGAGAAGADAVESSTTEQPDGPPTRRPPPRPGRSAPEPMAQARAESSGDTEPDTEPDTPAGPDPRAEPPPDPPADPEADGASASADATPAPSSSVSPAAAADPLTPQAVTAAWTDHVAATLVQKARSRFSTGEWRAPVDGLVVFAVPNSHLQRRCAEVVPMVSEALSAHFSQPLRVEVVVDSGAAPASAAEPRPVGAEAPSSSSDTVADNSSDDPSEGLANEDLSSLEDANDVALSTAERVAAMFDGAELVTDDS